VASRSAAANGPLWGKRARDWSQIQEPATTALYEAVLAHLAVGPGLRLLDAGCGSGLALRMAADRGAQVAGLDASTALLAVAIGRLPGAELHQGDLEALPFADRSFDLVTGFNAFQYAADPVRALAEARRVTRPGGKVAVTVWGEPEGMAMAGVITALAPLLPRPPAGTGGPFALSPRAALADLAQTAGLNPEGFLDIPTSFDYADEAAALRGLRSSGVAARAIALAGEAAVDAAHARALAPFREADGSYRVPAAFRCLIACV
jgi:SAM-dependent methyltransferase